MQIHQFNLQFNAEEDRLIFRLNTKSQEEFRFYMTRRFVKLLWPVLQKLVKHDYTRREPEKAHVVKELVEFEKQQVIANANFKEKYTEAAQNFPLGEDFILLSRIQVKKGQNGDILCLLPSDNRGIEFPANHQFLHTFCKLLKDVVSRTGWQLDLMEIGQNQMIAGSTVH